MDKRILVFRVYGCRMTLNVPDALIGMGIGNLRKFFKWAQKNPENDQSILQFFSYIPETAEYLKEKWADASQEFQREYRDSKFDSHGNYITDKEERNRRQYVNKKLHARVKETKHDYERFVERTKKLEEMRRTINVSEYSY